MIEALLDVLAPECCRKCSKVGEVLCGACEEDEFFAPPEVCFACNQLSESSKTCLKCRRKHKINNLMYVSNYKNLVRDLVLEMKLSSARKVAVYLGDKLNEYLPYFEVDVVSYVPSSPQNTRVRGYDHVKLIAKAFATKRNLKLKKLLTRINNHEQKKLSIKQRQKAVAGAFLYQGARTYKRILLIDDVISSGLTMGECNKVLKNAGNKNIISAVVARNYIS